MCLPNAARRDALQAAADAVMLTIAERLPPRYRGAYAEGTDAWYRGRHALAAGWVAPLASAPSPLRVVAGALSA